MESKNGIRRWENRPQAGFQLRNPIQERVSFYVSRLLRNPERNLRNCTCSTKGLPRKFLSLLTSISLLPSPPRVVLFSRLVCVIFCELANRVGDIGLGLDSEKRLSCTFCSCILVFFIYFQYAVYFGLLLSNSSVWNFYKFKEFYSTNQCEFQWHNFQGVKC